MRSQILAIGLTLALAGPATGNQAVVGPFESRATVEPGGRIDELVFGRLRDLDIQPANLCSDAVFLRRVYLDVIGTLPTAREARRFLRDRNPEKRRVLVDHLLGREEFADYWAMKWCDLLRVKAEFPVNLWPNAVQAYHRWIRTSIAENLPYDRFVREMLTASGSNFRVPQVNFYRAIQGRSPEAIAKVVALTFMGTRTENWQEARRVGMAAFFREVGYKRTAEWKEEIVYFDPSKAEADSAATVPALFPDGARADLSGDEDPREVFADWLIAPENPWFAPSIVNRIWYWTVGRGIVHEADDFGPNNPPQNPELLSWLSSELVDAGYDLKHIYRLILNSTTYQLSCIPRSDHPDAEAAFAYYPIRRLDAEVLIDALCSITGTKESYSSAIPEPFTFIPESQRSIQLADGSITSSFLEMFGRPPRDTGLESERNNAPTAAQRLHLLNSSHIQRKIQRSPRLRRLFRARARPREMVARLYLTILSRFPTEAELKAILTYRQSDEVRPQEVAVDLAWALINSPEFLYRH